MDSSTRLLAECLVALALFAIAVAFVPLALREREPGVRRMIALLSAIFLLGSISQLAPLWTARAGSYLLEGFVRLLAAVVAFELVRVIRKLRTLPSRLELVDRVHERTAELEGSNRALQREVAERDHAEKRFHLAVESSPAGMVMIDSKGRIVLVNRATEEIFEYHREELIKQSVEILVPDRFKPVHPSHRERFLGEPVTRAMGVGRELFGLRSDGSEVPIEIGLNPIQTEEGLFVLSSIVDITERKHAEQLVRAKNAQLERTNRELDQFAHVVSHDLKAPLRGIISLSTWIAEDCAERLPKESHEHLQLLVQRTGRMSELIDGILHYSRAGREGPPAEPVDVEELVGEVIDSVAPPPSISVHVDGKLPIVHYDRTQLRQVFQNLLVNAIQHLGRPVGEVVISCREEPSTYEFSVSDNGVGIEERHFERIFRIFQALDSDAPTAGIGLSIVKKIVEKNGGSVCVVSQPGAGASFRFSVSKASTGATRQVRRHTPKEKSGEERTDPSHRG